MCVHVSHGAGGPFSDLSLHILWSGIVHAQMDSVQWTWTVGALVAQTSFCHHPQHMMSSELCTHELTDHKLLREGFVPIPHFMEFQGMEKSVPAWAEQVSQTHDVNAM